MEALTVGEVQGLKRDLVRELVLTVADACGLPYGDRIDLLRKPVLEDPLDLKRRDDGPGEGGGNDELLAVDRRHLAMSVHSDGSAQMWDLGDGRRIKSFQGHGEPVSSAACLPGGELALTAAGTALRLWEVESGRCLQLLRPHSAAVNSAVFCLGEVLSGSDDGTAKLSSWATGQALLTLPHSAEVQAVAAWEEGLCAATLTAEGCLSSWCLASGRRLWWHAAKAQCAPRFLKGGALLYLAENHECVLCEASSGALLQSFSAPCCGPVPQQYDAHGFVALAGSPDGRLVLAHSRSGHLRVWSRRTGECVQLLETELPVGLAGLPSGWPVPAEGGGLAAAAGGSL